MSSVALLLHHIYSSDWDLVEALGILFRRGIVAWYPKRTVRVTDQNVGRIWSSPARLKIMLENSYLYEKIQKDFHQQIAQTRLFQMRYDSLPNPEKQPSDSLRGWVTSCFHIILVLLMSFLFLLELRRHWPKSFYILVCHWVTSCSISGYHTPMCRGVL